MTRVSRLLLAAFSIFLVLGYASETIAACPPNSHPYSDEGNVVHCACNSGYELGAGECVRVQPESAFDTQSRKWVERGFKGGACNSPDINGHDLNFVDTPQSVGEAWKFLKKCRASGESAGLEVAAAENYLYIRFVASESGDTGFKIAPDWYYTLKLIASKAGFLQRLKTSSQPVSDPSQDVHRWGNLGYSHGIRDYEKRTGRNASLKTAALETCLYFLAGLYYR